MRLRMNTLVLAASLAPTALLPANIGAEEPQASRHLVLQRGIGFLRAAQAEDGSYSSQTGPAVTALATTALLQNGVSPSDPTVTRGIAYVLRYVQRDGGIYNPGSFYRNYETCLAILCLQAANRQGEHTETLAKAEAFIRDIQWDESEGHSRSDAAYGGSGYGKHKRPDLSNTQFTIDALQTLGAGPDDPAIQAALVFVSRSQNLETEHNTTKWSAIENDGSFYYTPAAGGSSQAGRTPRGGLRGYGSMTYAGLKSMIFAGVAADDPRVKAAFEWAQKHYTLDQNPGLGKAGLYYYYHTFAKALDAIGTDTVTDGSGAEHAWKQELVSKLATEQNADGSWTNSNERWMEGDANLVTAYALLALSYCE